ncbi:MAG TPA: hypothetical protein VMA35_15615 [Candidatus Sulfopaludibacter sp.]|nr:hypothetical protein [Candidatus Sulfopaludibacter sp.]
MNSKLLLSLALILSFLLTGCAAPEFSVVPDTRQLARNHRVVAEVTCIKADSILCTRHLALFPTHYIRCNAEFRVDRILQGEFTGCRFALVNAEGAGIPESGFDVFETNKIYTVGFDSVIRGNVKHFAVVGQESASPPPKAGDRP